MADDDLADFYVHQVTVTPLEGTGAYGPVFGQALTVAGFLDSATHLVRSATGQEVVSQSTLYTDLDHAAAFLPGSAVTLPDGARTVVITTNARTAPGLDLPDHLEVQME